jgi:hypothetical protein
MQGGRVKCVGATAVLVISQCQQPEQAMHTPFPLPLSTTEAQLAQPLWCQGLTAGHQQLLMMTRALLRLIEQVEPLCAFPIAF